jgi:TolB-like protein/Tfp pilus assembly protein PilF
VDLLSRIAGWLGENEATISAVAAILAIGVILFTGLRFLLRRRDETVPEKTPAASAEPASAAEASPPGLDPLTVPGFEGRPAIAVLPFDNLSGDPDQEYFADGIAEDLITRLSQWRWFPVIARNSSFTYKGTPVDVKEVSRALGARYIVEGSVRRSEERVRVAVQLIDATTGAHVWAENYDRETKDIFTLQDEITEAVVASVFPELWRSEQGRAVSSNPQDLGAWDTAQRAWWHLYRFTKDDLAEAVSLFRVATEENPKFAYAFAGLAFAYQAEVDNQWSDSAERSVSEMYRAARHAVDLDSEAGICHAALGAAYAHRSERDKAIAALERAVEIDPGVSNGYRLLGTHLAFGNRPDEAIRALEKAIRLSPRDPWMYECLYGIAIAHVAASRYEEALDWAERLRQRKPDFPFTYLVLAGTCAELGRLDEARAAVDEALRRNPHFSLSGLRLALAIADPSLADRILNALREAGLPE